jgi:hypothetical protein
MKKLTQVSVILALLAIPASMAAHDRPCRGMGFGMMGHGGYDMMSQPCKECGSYHSKGNTKEVKTLNEEEAKKKMEMFVAKHLKGFSIVQFEKEQVPRGTMYWAVVKEKNGNEMELHMNPWGYIRGPFIR